MKFVRPAFRGKERLASGRGGDAVRRSAGSVVEELECRRLMTRLVGVDVSSYQGAITWSTVKNSKQFAMIRATTGQNTVDSRFASNATNAVKNGLYAGFYHYAYYDLDGHTAVSEADHFFDTVKPYLKADGKHLMPVLDVEEGATVAVGGTLDTWVNAWCQRVASRALSELGLAVTPMIYTSASHASSYFSSGVVPLNYPLWVAQWPSSLPNTQTAQPSGVGDWQSSTSPFSYSSWSFWQYSDAGSVSGISGRVDLDVFQGNESALQTYVIGSDGRWAAGTRVQVNTSVKAWNTPSANGSSVNVPSGTRGTIVNNATYSKTHAYGNSFWRWYVQFDNGTSGWVGEYQSVQPTSPYTPIDWLTAVAPSVVTSPNPASSSTTFLNPPPATFTWGGGANATSYVVYLDNVKKATVTAKSWNHPALANGTHTWRVDAVNGDVTTAGPTWTFVSGLPPAYTSGSTLYVNFASTGTAIINASGSNIVVSQNGTNYTFPAASVAAIDVAATAGNDALTIFGRIAAPITFDDGGGSDTITINPSARVILAADVPGATVVLGSGAFLEAAAPLHLASLSIGGGTVYLDPSGDNTLAVGDLSITGGGNLDLSDNALVWDYAAGAGTPADTLRTYLSRARNGGTWDGSGGIGSSEAYADPTHTAALGYLEASSLGVTSFAGVDVDDTALVVKYTVAGDVNLNGAVDGDDYALTDRAFARNAANPHWLNGDFDYDGVLSANDYLLLDTSALVQGGGTPSPMLLATREATFGPAYVSALTAAVTPEPETTTAPADPATPPFSDAPIAADATTTAADPAPVTVVTGPKNVRRHKPAHFKFAVADAPVGNRYTYSVDWNGDSIVDQTVTGDASVALGHRFAQAGQGGLNLWVTDDATGLTSDPTSLAFRIL